jgi:hypothetical protein
MVRGLYLARVFHSSDIERLDCFRELGTHALSAASDRRITTQASEPRDPRRKDKNQRERAKHRNCDKNCECMHAYRSPAAAAVLDDDRICPKRTLFPAWTLAEAGCTRHEIAAILGHRDTSKGGAVHQSESEAPRDRRHGKMRGGDQIDANPIEI